MQLLLEVVELGELGLRLGGLLLLGELLVPDLLQGAAALAAHLEHVGRDAFRYCRKRRVRTI